MERKGLGREGKGGEGRGEKDVSRHFPRETLINYSNILLLLHTTCRLYVR